MRQIVIKIDLPEDDPSLRPDEEIIAGLEEVVRYDIAETLPFTVEIVNKN